MMITLMKMMMEDIDGNEDVVMVILMMSIVNLLVLLLKVCTSI